MAWSVEVIESRLFAGVVADEIVASVQDIEAEGDFCSVALAGGSTPAETYRLLSHPPRVGEVNWHKLRLFLSDERWVPSSDAQNNFKMISETLLARIPPNSAQSFPVDTSLGSPQDAVKKYDEIVRENVRTGSDGLPCFDIVLLGIGEDGHIASIFPDSSLLSQTNSLYAAVQQPWDNRYRVTLTPRMIMCARRVIALAKGKAKAEIVKRVIEGDEGSSVLPGRLLAEHTGEVSWYVDSEAAQLLARK